MEGFLGNRRVEQIVCEAFGDVCGHLPDSNPCRSRAFVREMASRFQRHAEKWNAHAKTSFARRIGGGGEVGYDISVDVMRDKVVATSVLQLESEFAATLPKNGKVKLSRTELYKDFNKLVRGCAHTRIMLTSMEWYSRCIHRKKVQCDFAFGMRDQDCEFFLVYVPFPKYWDQCSTQDIRFFKLMGREFHELPSLPA